MTLAFNHEVRNAKSYGQWENRVKLGLTGSLQQSQADLVKYCT